MATTSYRNFLLQKYQYMHINPCDFFLWGFFKEKLFLRNPDEFLELKGINQPTLRTIYEILCAKVVANTRTFFL